jgi:hypothetical protein
MNGSSCAGKSRLDIDLEPQNGQVPRTENRANHRSSAESTKAERRDTFGIAAMVRRARNRDIKTITLLTGSTARSKVKQPTTQPHGNKNHDSTTDTPPTRSNTYP